MQLFLHRGLFPGHHDFRTVMLTGITEPLEFTFLFIAPAMYAAHCVYAGLSYMSMHIFNVRVGMTFSGGLIDLTLSGVLQGNAKTP